MSSNKTVKQNGKFLNKILNILFIIVISTISKAQTSGLQFKILDNNYNWKTHSSYFLDSFYYNLLPIEMSKYKSHIRFDIHSKGITIDLYSNNDSVFAGRITNHIIQYNYKKSNKLRSSQDSEKYIICDQNFLDSTSVQEAVKIILNGGQINFPTDSLIPNWKKGFLHCNGLTYQYNFNGVYNMQNYSCPWGQTDTITYIKDILKIYLSIYSVLKLDSLNTLFESKLPKGETYTNDGYRLRYFYSEKEIAYYKRTKPQRDYMLSVKDTIDKYLKAELKKQYLPLDSLDCRTTYYLLFKKNGKFKKVYISKARKLKYRDAYGLSDFIYKRQQMRKCKSKINKVFKKIDISFLDLEYRIFVAFLLNHRGLIEFNEYTAY